MQGIKNYNQYPNAIKNKSIKIFTKTFGGIKDYTLLCHVNTKKL